MRGGENVRVRISFDFGDYAAQERRCGFLQEPHAHTERRENEWENSFVFMAEVGGRGGGSKNSCTVAAATERQRLLAR